MRDIYIEKKGGGSQPSFSDHGQIIENPSNWGDMTSSGYNWIPEFPTLASTLLALIVPAIVVAIRKRRLLKTPIH